MGSVIPIKVATGYEFPKTGNAYDTGESCSKKVRTPQICKTQRILFPRILREYIRKGWSHAMRQMKRLAMGYDRNSILAFLAADLSRPAALF